MMVVMIPVIPKREGNDENLGSVRSDSGTFGVRIRGEFAQLGTRGCWYTILEPMTIQEARGD